MARTHLEVDREESASKRRKLSQGPPPLEQVEIKSSSDLQHLLAFSQDAGQDVKHKVQRFRGFLSSIQDGNHPRHVQNQAILLDFFRSKTSGSEGDATAFSGLIRSWHFAVQANGEHLISSIAAAFASLLKAISTLVDFREAGLSLCRVLLQDDQMSLFDRALTANRAKEHLIDPCLRLLTEILRFDGGTCAKLIHRQRNITFHRLDVFLSYKQQSPGDDVGKKRRAPVHELAHRYLLANLQFQGPIAKAAILNNGPIVRAFLQILNRLPSRLVLETLDGLRNAVLADASLSTPTKNQFFNESNLRSLSSLYNYKEETENESNGSVRTKLHALLLAICVLSESSLLKTSGAAHVDPEHSFNHAIENSSTDGLGSMPRSTRNLLTFLSSLRPYADALQANLIIEVFEQAPHMIDAYFSVMKTFPFDPKPTATWVGYARFLLALIQSVNEEKLVQSLDIKSQGLTTLINCLLPRPLIKKVLTRCLNQSSQLLKFLTVQILNAAFAKIERINQLRLVLGQNAKEGAEGLVMALADRCPDMSVIIMQFQSCSDIHAVLKESLGRSLIYYYQILPQVALEEKFDISPALARALDAVERVNEEDEKSLQYLYLEHLIEIASFQSSTVQWFHKIDDHLSPFTKLLRYHVKNEIAGDQSKILATLISIAEDHGLSQSHHSSHALAILLLSLQYVTRVSKEIYGYLDDCTQRLVKKPAEYQELLLSLYQDSSNDSSDGHGDDAVDLILIALVEQWPHLRETASSQVANGIAQWLDHYLSLTALAGCNNDILLQLSKQFRDLEGGDSQLQKTLEDLKQQEDLESGVTSSSSSSDSGESDIVIPDVVETDDAPGPASAANGCSVPEGPPEESLDHPGLYRWSKQDVMDAVGDGLIGDLILCLCSQEVSVRKEALRNLGTFNAKLKSSTHREQPQLYVLLGEIIETATPVISSTPLSYFAGILASKMLLVLLDPLHFMYVKVCTFLHRRPAWELEKLPSYWVDKATLQAPSEDDAHYAEVSWLLDILVEGLRTSADMTLYWRCNILERVLTLTWSPSLPDSCFQRIVDFCFRCTYVDGSTTLIIRCGLMGWISCCLSRKSGQSRDRLLLLAVRAHETCDQGKIDAWSDGGFDVILQALARIGV